MLARRYQLILASLRIDLGEIQRLILETPTGDKRNALCDAQIHCLAAIRTLEEQNHA